MKIYFIYHYIIEIKMSDVDKYIRDYNKTPNNFSNSNQLNTYIHINNGYNSPSHSFINNVNHQVNRVQTYNIHNYPYKQT